MSSPGTGSGSGSGSGSAPALIRVGIAGATGVVGQRFVSLLSRHPFLRLVVVSASERSAGRLYSEACSWRLGGEEELPALAGALEIQATTLEAFRAARVSAVFSALDASVAGDFEEALAAAGIAVFSNARNHRYDARVPILVPHANAEHIDIIPQQRAERGYPKGGFIVTNANCSSTGLAVALRVSSRGAQTPSIALTARLMTLAEAASPTDRSELHLACAESASDHAMLDSHVRMRVLFLCACKPLRDAFGIDKLFVTTMQAISGAGYPGESQPRPIAIHELRPT